MTKLFTEEEVIRLCTAIRNRPSLYDPNDPNFGKSLANKAVWDEIARLFEDKGFTADDVKLKWKNLRDTMALLLRKSNRDPNTWRFYEYCAFLNQYERPPRKNGRKSAASTPQMGLLNKSEPMKRPAPMSVNDSGISDQSLGEPPEKQYKPTLVVNSNAAAPAKAEDLVEQSDTSNSNFEDTHDSILKHFVSNATAAHQGTVTTNGQATVHSASTGSLLHHAGTPVNHVQSPYPLTRDIYDIFGEETAIRLRAIAECGNRTLFVHARRRINELLDEVELELYSGPPAAHNANNKRSPVASSSSGAANEL